MKNRIIENPIIKDKITFVRTSDETNGEVSEIIVDLSPGGGNEPHYHTSQSHSLPPRASWGSWLGENGAFWSRVKQRRCLQV